MKNISCHKRALFSCTMIAVLSACGQALPPMSTRGFSSGAARVATGQDLLYVSTWLYSTRLVYMLTYPQGQLVGSLTGMYGRPSYLCSDKNGNVFATTAVTVQSGVIYEFVHGATSPMKALNDPGAPVGCSVDPRSGDLAVTNGDSPYHKDYGDIVVYKNGSGQPTVYGDKRITAFRFCGYDSHGNLLADGIDRLYQNVLMLLPHGATSLTVLKLDKTLPDPGPIQWDGRYFAVGFVLPHKIYRVAVSGSQAKVITTIQLTYKHYQLADSLALFHNTLIADIGPRHHANASMGFWKYPSGGKADGFIRRIGDALSIQSVTVSAAPKR
jgi:hypothetical protein